jgi:hypothetical protein
MFFLQSMLRRLQQGAAASSVSEPRTFLQQHVQHTYHCVQVHLGTCTLLPLLRLPTCLPAGGALCIAGEVKAEVTNGSLLSNSLKPLVVMQQATLTVSNSTLAHNYELPPQDSNKQQQPGGALVAYDSSMLLLQGSLLHNNSAGVGGALLATHQSCVTIKGSDISRNAAIGQGAFCRDISDAAAHA